MLVWGCYRQRESMRHDTIVVWQLRLDAQIGRNPIVRNGSELRVRRLRLLHLHRGERSTTNERHSHDHAAFVQPRRRLLSLVPLQHEWLPHQHVASGQACPFRSAGQLVDEEKQPRPAVARCQSHCKLVQHRAAGIHRHPGRSILRGHRRRQRLRQMGKMQGVRRHQEAGLRYTKSSVVGVSTHCTRRLVSRTL